jgi:hypothetical protein
MDIDNSSSQTFGYLNRDSCNKTDLLFFLGMNVVLKMIEPMAKGNVNHVILKYLLRAVCKRGCVHYVL